MGLKLAILFKPYKASPCVGEACGQNRYSLFRWFFHMAVKKYSVDFGGKPLSVEIGRLGGQANGVCLIQYGETSVLCNATMSSQEKAVDYMPLSVEYEEKYYAAGKIKGSKWIKRETRPS